MIYLEVIKTWREDLPFVECGMNRTHPYSTALLQTGQTIKLWYTSPVAHLNIGDRLVQLTEMVYVEEKLFVIFQHDKSDRIFSLTSRVQDDKVDDGLIDITCNG